MKKMAFKRIWKPVAAILVFICIWEAGVRLLAVEEWFLPAPSSIIVEGKAVFPEFLPHVAATFSLSITGFFIGSLVGLAAAIFLHLNRWGREMFYPFLILSQNVPVIVLAPLLVIWLGFGAAPKLIIITLACFFPIAMATLQAFQQTNRNLSFYMNMMGATEMQVFWKLQFPYAIPSIIAGLKIAATYSVMAAVISEWLGAQKGIGVFMTVASSSYKTSRVFIAILVTMLLSLAFFGLIVLLEKVLGRFQRTGEMS